MGTPLFLMSCQALPGLQGSLASRQMHKRTVGCRLPVMLLQERSVARQLPEGSLSCLLIVQVLSARVDALVYLKHRS